MIDPRCELRDPFRLAAYRNLLTPGVRMIVDNQLDYRLRRDYDEVRKRSYALALTAKLEAERNGAKSINPFDQGATAETPNSGGEGIVGIGEMGPAGIPSGMTDLICWEKVKLALRDFRVRVPATCRQVLAQAKDLPPLVKEVSLRVRGIVQKEVRGKELREPEVKVMVCVSIVDKRGILQPNAHNPRARAKEVRVSRDTVGAVDSGVIRDGGVTTLGSKVLKKLAPRRAQGCQQMLEVRG